MQKIGHGNNNGQNMRLIMPYTTMETYFPMQGAGNRHRGILNIGFNPTFAGQTLSIEVHIFDFNENIYGKALEILFIERIRYEIRFESPEKLIAQINRDIIQARVILKEET